MTVFDVSLLSFVNWLVGLYVYTQISFKSLGGQEVTGYIMSLTISFPLPYESFHLIVIFLSRM